MPPTELVVMLVELVVAVRVVTLVLVVVSVTLVAVVVASQVGRRYTSLSSNAKHVEFTTTLSSSERSGRSFSTSWGG